jgi:hypothetical protein
VLCICACWIICELCWFWTTCKKTLFCLLCIRAR